MVSVLLITSGCSDNKPNIVGESGASIYKSAYNLLDRGEYGDAAQKFKDVETYFPYSEKSCAAQVMSAYCHFKAGSYSDAIREIDVFLRYHPSHELVPYSMYLKAMCMYMNVATVGRDPKQAEEARATFLELINRFPHSKYSEDSIKRVVILDDIIAAHEMMIGRYYQKNNNALSAISRYNRVISKFSQTKSVEEALYRIIECCKSLDLKEAEESTKSVLKERFPKGEWTKKLSN